MYNCHEASIEYDNNKNEFLTAIADRQVVGFTIQVLFWNRRVRGEESTEAGSLKNTGTILQAFTHEMSVHAENMLDFSIDYLVLGPIRPLNLELQVKNMPH